MKPFAVTPVVGDVARCDCGARKMIINIQTQTNDGQWVRRIEWQCEGPCGRVWTSWSTER